MVRKILAINDEETYYTSRTPQPICQFLYNIWISLFPKYLSHCCCCLTIQYGVVSYSVMGITVVAIPMFINSAEAWIVYEWIIPFILMCIYCALMIVGHFLTIMSAFMFHRKLLLLGLIMTAVGMVIWLTLLIAAFFPHILEDYVCINHVCADSHWIIDLRWRYKKSDCPFRKGDPLQYPVFRKHFFVDAPRDDLWENKLKLGISMNLAIKKSDLVGQHLDKVINFKAWYPGCESNDTVLILISIILAVAYLAFIGHLWWMVLSLRNIIVEEENEYDDDEEDEESY